MPDLFGFRSFTPDGKVNIDTSDRVAKFHSVINVTYRDFTIDGANFFKRVSVSSTIKADGKWMVVSHVPVAIVADGVIAVGRDWGQGGFYGTYTVKVLVYYY